MPISLRLRTADDRPASATGHLLIVDGVLYELLDPLPADATPGEVITLRGLSLETPTRTERSFRLTVVAVQHP